MQMVDVSVLKEHSHLQIIVKHKMFHNVLVYQIPIGMVHIVYVNLDLVQMVHHVSVKV
jgi:hypothetical protein